MKKSGFIAISLLYSFLLIFVTLILALILSYAQNRILNKNMSKVANNNIEKYKVIKKDNSFANQPILMDYMLPIRLNNNNKWIIADSKNTNNDYKWYNYTQAIWAHSVKFKDSYKDCDDTIIEVGTQVEDNTKLKNCIEGYYVWIPIFSFMKTNNYYSINFQAIINDSFTLDKIFVYSSIVDSGSLFENKEEKHYRGIWVKLNDSSYSSNDALNTINKLKNSKYGNYGTCEKHNCALIKDKATYIAIE